MKRLILLISLIPLTTVAAETKDWLDEMADLAASRSGFTAKKASAIIEKYIKADKKQIAELEKQQKQNSSKGVLSGARDLTFKGELASWRTSLRYHEGVAFYIRELADNKKDREAFAQECKTLKRLTNEVQALQKQLDKDSAAGKAVDWGKIAVKKTEIAAIRTHLKAIKF